LSLQIIGGDVIFQSQEDFLKQEKLIKKFGEGNAYLLWSLSMHLDDGDIDELAAEALTDQPNDKKIDFIFLDPDEKRLVFAQGYYSKKGGEQAPANKASDLNTAAAWLISGDLKQVPQGLAEIIREARSAIETGEVDTIELLYVHNLPESKNVLNELKTVEAHLTKGFAKSNVRVSALELGLEQLEKIFVAKESQILVRETITCPAKLYFEEEGPKWKAAVTSVRGDWLRSLFSKYGDPLFSANYRGFLGVSKRKRINSGIKQSAENEPHNFWVFNNGVSILTLEYKPNGDNLVLNGLSVINGAQTTGSLASAKESETRVMVRIIECTDAETVKSIVRFNNTQNEITTWDQYSNTEEQKKIQQEMQLLGHNYSLKRGFAESLSGMGIEVVAQPLLAFHGDFQTANRGKNGIFERMTTYNKAFQHKTARHILFVYTLAKAINSLNLELKQKRRDGGLIEIETQQLELFRSLKFKYFLIALTARTLESFVGKACNLESIGFTSEASSAKNRTLEELRDFWLPVVRAVTALLPAQLKGRDLSQMFSSEEELAPIAETMKGIIYVTRGNLSLGNFPDLITTG
jgi:AIPR protein